jgi:hypothetical protein
MMVALKIFVTVLVFAAAASVLYSTWCSDAERGAATASAAQPAFPRCVPPAVATGMTKAALRAACGPPSSISHQFLNGGTVDQEQWAYDETGSYIYLRNGIVDGMQYAENGERFSWKN